MNREELEYSYTSARKMHHAGRLDAARAAYEKLLELAPDDGDVRGLLGVLAIQEGRDRDAERLLRAALAASAEPRIKLRNLNNLLALLQKSGDAQAARDLIAAGVPDWPAGVAPEPAERATVLSVCAALLLLGDARRAHRLMNQAIPDPEADPEMAGMAGRIKVALGEIEAAAEDLERAAAAADAEAETLVSLSFVQQKLGRAQAARSTVDRVCRTWPVFDAPPHRSHRAEILVLNPTPGEIKSANAGLQAFHFSANFAAQMAYALRDEFRFRSVFADLPPGDLPQDLPAAGVILNNCVNAETMNIPGRLERALELVARVGAPVINHPRAVFDTTRQKNAALLAGIPDLKVPQIERYRPELASAKDIAADIEGRFAYPVIIRKCHAHNSASLHQSAGDQVAVLAGNNAALTRILTNPSWREIYAIEYVPLRKRTGLFRKIRAVLAEDDVIVAIPGFARDWMASGGRGRQNGIDFYRSNPVATEESRRIALDPEGVLGAGCLRVLEAIRDRLPLDFFGIDFDVDDAGQVVFFEANAAMNLLKRLKEPDDITLPDQPFERIRAAFRRAVERRMAGAG